MLPFAPEGLVYIATLLAVTLIGWVLKLPWLYVICGALTAFVAYFFRDPDRVTLHDPRLAVSPADGKVMWVDPIEHDEYIGGPAQRISIFLSVFNVHVNRAPISGTVTMKSHRRGKMLSAYKKEASAINERVSIGIEGEKARVVVHQVTGLIARRIVCRVREGEKVVQGQRYGLIKFGSCTELIVPASAIVEVKPGDRVVGAETVLAKFPEA